MSSGGLSLSAHEALSGIFGSISLASWVFLLVPQLAENYQSQSAEGISLAFLTVWLIGDVTNLVGAMWAGLVPTVVALAIYFCFADLVLLSQCFYYNSKHARKAARRQSLGCGDPEIDDPEQPLLGQNSDNIGLPGSRRRSSTSQKRRDSTIRNPSLGNPEGESSSWVWFKNTVCVFLVCVAGTAGWAIAWKLGVWSPSPAEVDDGTANRVIGAEILGYISAICYLGARIPQIIKNYKERSCEGLSLLFFILSLLGNATYGAGILFHSIRLQYFLANLPWLIGSLGTMGEDALIFLQFHLYTKHELVEASSAIE